jgi:hypothetical protein
MQIDVHASFPYPTLFSIASRAAGVAAPPVEPIGVFIAKQTVELDGITPAPRNQQQEVLLTDVKYDPFPPDAEDVETRLEIHLESDLAAYKPELDVVVVRNSSLRDLFGHVRIDRRDETGFQPNPAWPLAYGWLSRVAANDPPNVPPPPAPPPPVVNPRKGLEGLAGSFEPDVANKFKLPTNFRNTFFNGSRIRGVPHLQAGHIVEYQYLSGTSIRRVTIPAGPTLSITVGSSPVLPPVAIERNVDTVIYNQTAGHFLVTWRAVFAWEERLADATLEVS